MTIIGVTKQLCSYYDEECSSIRQALVLWNKIYDEKKHVGPTLAFR